MERPNNTEGGFGGYNRIDIESQQHETISKSSLNSSKEGYVDSIMQATGLRGTKHKKRLQRYYDENNNLINPQQNSLLQSRFRTVVEGISNQQKSKADISGQKNDYTQVSSGDPKLDEIFDRTIGNIGNSERKKDVPIDGVDTDISTEQTELSPEQQARINEYPYPTRPANKNDYFRGFTLPERLYIEVDSDEHNKLKKAIEELGVMPKLVEVDKIIKEKQTSGDISNNHRLTFINATRELYGLNPLQTTSEVKELLESLPDDRVGEPIPVEGEAQSQYYIVEDSRFNLPRYNGDKEMRFTLVKDDLLELGMSETELDKLILSRGIPNIPSKSIQIGDKIVDWDDEDQESRLSYRTLAVAEYYGIDTNNNLDTDVTQATVGENRLKPITDNTMNNEAWKNLNTGETSQTFGHLPDPNTEEEPTIEGRATRRRSSAQEGDISSTDEIQPTTTEPEALANVTDIESPKATKEDFGTIPEDPYNIRDKDRQALITLFESHPEVFPEGNYVDVSTWNDWKPLAIGEEKKEGSSKFYVYIENGDKQSIDFDTKEKAEVELARMKAPDKQKALDLIVKARNFSIGEDLEALWDDNIALDTSAISIDSEPITTEPEASDPGNSEPQPVPLTNQDVIVSSPEDSQQPSEAENTKPTDLNLDELQSELSRLVTEAANKLNIEQEQENNQEYSSRLDREKIDIFTENAKKAIKDYQTFANEHSSPLYKSNTEIQKMYQALEQVAWDALYKLAHYLDGEIATLPTDRGIQLSHPGGVDTKQYLEEKGYKFDENGNITYIADKGIEIELNRPIRMESLIKSKRPSRVLYLNSLKSSAISNDIQDGFGKNINIIKDNKQIPSRDWDRPITNNVDLDMYSDRDKPSYYHSYLTKGYLINGLNNNTPDFITAILNRDIISEVIVDETKQPQTEVSNINEFNPLQQAQIDRGKEAGFTDEEISRYAKPEYDEVQMRDIFNQILEEKNVNTSVIGPDIPQEIPENSEANNIDTLSDLRLAYARAEEAWNRDTKNRDLENEFDKARDAYNDELERVLKLQVAQGQEANIHELFKNEVTSLREERITQSQELQGTWEKRLNPLKEKFVNFVIKHKKLMGRVNLGLGIAGGALALTGVGIPLAGGLAVTRRAISGVLLGVSSGEGVRSLGEDADINLAWGQIKFQAVIPKLVQESLSTNADDFKKVSDNVLKDRLGTLEAYYRLNGGKFTNNDQQKAYEKILIELGHRVRINTLENYQNAQESSSEQTQDISANQDGLQESVDTSSQDNNSTELVNSSNTETFNFGESRYTSELLNTISDKRVQELDEFRRKRRIATVTGIGVGLLVGGAVHLLDEIKKPDSLDVPESVGSRPNLPDAGEGNVPNPSTAPEITPGTTPPAPEVPPTGAGEALSQSDQLAQSAEATRVSAEQAAQQAAEQVAEQLAQDVSSLDPGETIWGEVAKQLGENATDAQIQQAVENLLQSEVGQNSIYELAQGTEGGRALLAQWGIDNATEMAELSKEQLYEISRYLAPGELQGITELSLENLTPFEAVEPQQVDVSEAMDTPTSTTEAPTPSVEPTPSAPPGSTPAPEAPPITSTEFTRGLSEALGTTNLTEIQVGNILEAYIENPQNKESLYYLILDSQQNNPDLTNLLMEYRVSDIDKFVALSPDRMYKLAELVGVENLDKLPGFELNDIILSKFEDAPDSLNLVQGSKPLNLMDNYISKYAENLPGSRSLGKLVLEKYILETDEGRAWLYDAIVNNQDKTSAGAENLQKVRELFSRASIKSPEDLKRLLIDSRGYPSAQVFWDRLSWVLKPGEMPGIKKALGLALPTKQ